MDEILSEANECVESGERDGDMHGYGEWVKEMTCEQDDIKRDELVRVIAYLKYGTHQTKTQ